MFEIEYKNNLLILNLFFYFFSLFSFPYCAPPLKFSENQTLAEMIDTTDFFLELRWQIYDHISRHCLLRMGLDESS